MEAIWQGKRAESKTQAQFRNDMENAGYEVLFYHGRWFYEGWAVDVEKDELQDVIRSTDVKLQWDEMGLGLIVYPRLSKVAKREYNGPQFGEWY